MTSQAKAISVAAQSFAAVLRAANPPPPRDRLKEVTDKFLRGDITLTSFELQLWHMPGGIPETVVTSNAPGG